MNVSVPKETAGGERRVALVPEVVERLSASGVEVVVESGAGVAAGHLDPSYEEAGAGIGDGFAGEVVAKVAMPLLPDWLRPIAEADTICVTAGAGVGVDSGMARRCLSLTSRDAHLTAYMARIAGHSSWNQA
jgi:NAD/NADP transhydrogenase alpha subunit